MKTFRKVLQKYWFYIAIIVLILVKQWLVCRLPIYARDIGGADQWKMLKKAEDLLAGNYWEIYTCDTMFKRDILFPGFLAICHFVKLSYLAGFSLFYAASALLTVYSFSYYCKKRIILLLAFAMVLFAPVSYAQPVQLVYNMALTAPLSLCLISCFMIAFHNCTEIKMYFIWNLVAGFFAAALWLNREDTQWLIPLIGVYVIISIITILRRRLRTKKKFWVCAVLPAAILVVANTAFCAANYVHYGIWATNDHIATGFAEAYNSILKIVPDSYPTNCSITRDMIDKAARESPSFEKLYGWLKDYYNTNTRMMLAGADPDDGEIEDGWMPFVLRYAAVSIGYYKDNPVETSAYWQDVSDELEVAFKEGRLEEREIFFFGSMLKHPWVKGQNYFERWMNSWGRVLEAVVRHRGTRPGLKYSTIDVGIIKRYEAMTYDNAIEGPVISLNISGQITIKNGSILKLCLENDSGEQLEWIPLLETEEQNGMQSSFSINNDYPLKNAAQKLYLCLYNDETIYKKIELNGEFQFDDMEISILFERYQQQISNDPAEAQAQAEVNRALKVSSIYEKLGMLFLFATVAAYIGICIKCIYNIKQKQKDERFFSCWIYMSAIIGSILVFSLALAYIDAFMFDTYVWYASQVTGLVDYLFSLALIAFSLLISCWNKEKKDDSRTLSHNME